MPTLKALELEDHIEDVSRASVCVLAGGDDALRSRSVRMLAEAAAPDDLPGSTVRRFEDVPDPCDVFDELRTVPFLGMEGRRVVIVEKGDAFLARNWERLAEYLRKPSPTGALILCLDGLNASAPPPARQGEPGGKERAKSWRAFVKGLSERGAVVDCRAPRWEDARQWCRARAERMGKKLTPPAASVLVEAVGPDLLALENELQKLSAYVEPETTISERHVGEIVAQARQQAVFELADVVARGDAAEALRLCGRLHLRGERPEAILAVLALRVRQLWQIKRLQASGVPQKDIAGQVNVPPFVVRRSLGALGRLSDEALARQLATLSSADLELKTQSLRAQEEEVWLERLVARLCEA